MTLVSLQFQDTEIYMCELTLVDIGLGLVRVLVELVTNGVLCSGGAGGEGCVAVLGNLLVGLLRCLRAGTLDGLGDVVGGVCKGQPG